MELSAILLLLGILIIVVLFVAQPFTSHWKVKVQSSHEMSSLLAERERTLNALQELDADQDLGKIPPEEYTLQRSELLQKGAIILRKLDELKEKQVVTKKTPDKINPTKQNVGQISDDALEELITKRRASRSQNAVGFCSKCGRPIIKTDKFCPSCGQEVNQSQAQPK